MFTPASEAPRHVVLLEGFGLKPTARFCQVHSQALVGLGCVACARDTLCPECVRVHTSTFPSHTLTPASADAAVLRSRLEAAAVARVESCHAMASEAAAPPIVTCALHKAAAIESELRMLASSATETRDQLLTNRDAAIEAITAYYDSLASTLEAEVERKQAALGAEEAACDAAVRDAQAVAYGVIEGVKILSDADVVAHAPALLRRVQAARAAVAAVPVTPVTSSFIAVSVPSIDALRSAAASAVGALKLAPSTAPPHTCTPHCDHSLRGSAVRFSGPSDAEVATAEVETQPEAAHPVAPVLPPGPRRPAAAMFHAAQAGAAEAILRAHAAGGSTEEADAVSGRFVWVGRRGEETVVAFVDPNHAQDGNTSLAEAARLGHTAAVEALVSLGADVHAGGHVGAGHSFARPASQTARPLRFVTAGRHPTAPCC